MNIILRCTKILHHACSYGGNSKEPPQNTKQLSDYAIGEQSPTPTQHSKNRQTHIHKILPQLDDEKQNNTSSQQSPRRQTQSHKLANDGAGDTNDDADGKQPQTISWLSPKRPTRSQTLLNDSDEISPKRITRSQKQLNDIDDGNVPRTKAQLAQRDKHRTRRNWMTALMESCPLLSHN